MSENGTEQTTPGVGPKAGNNKGRPNLFMTQAVYSKLTPQQIRSLDRFCSGLEFDRWERDKEIPRSITAKHAFVEYQKPYGRTKPIQAEY